MTLTVNAYKREGEKTSFVEVDYSETLAGIEICRTALWGHEAARSLGLTLLPSLAETDIWVEGDDLDRLEWEVQTILANLGRLEKETGCGADYIQVRSGNILRAIARARGVGGGVVIW